MAKRRPAVPVPAVVEGALDAALDRALHVQRSAVIGYLDRIRARHRDLTPEQLVRLLERRYLAAVAAIGAASGGAAAVPGVGTSASLASAVLEISAFTEATALFTLAVAEVYGVRAEDPAFRRALVLAVLLGDSGAAELTAAAAGSRWGMVLAHRVPEETIHRVNRTLGKHFAKHFGARQGALVFARALPLGIGAGIGAAGNMVLARTAIDTARRAFGRLPTTLPPRTVEGTVVDGSRVDGRGDGHPRPAGR